MKYTINFNTGAGDKVVDDNIYAAMDQADSGATYTQQPITIEDESGNEVARREWYGVSDGWEDENNPIRFGDFGFYADWYEL